MSWASRLEPNERADIASVSPNSTFGSRMTLGEAHRVMDEVETKLGKTFPDVDITIHPEPEGHLDPDEENHP